VARLANVVRTSPRTVVGTVRWSTTSPRPDPRRLSRRRPGRRAARTDERAKYGEQELAAPRLGACPLDDQLRIEAWNSYTCVDRDEASSLLQRFYDKPDTG
jgi:hypothetical protein